MTAYVPDGEKTFEDKVYTHSVDKSQISQNSSTDIGLWVMDGGNPISPDAGSAKATLYKVSPQEENPIQVRILSVVESEPGLLTAKLEPGDTTEQGYLKVVWEYTFNGSPIKYNDWFSVISTMMEYDVLSDMEKMVVREVKWMFDDLYDSVNGGPHFQEEFQTEWNLNRYAQLLRQAIHTINMGSQPLTSYGVGGMGDMFPAKYYGLLVQALYVQVIKHFMRTYVEQPGTNGGPGVAYLDRRDYMNRWQTIYQMESADLQKSVDIMKMDMMNLGGGSLLVSGGIFGAGGRGGYAGSMWTAAARGMRFYPQSNIIVR